ncbi:MAG: septum formation protein Maf [Actinobacteria bacterium]|nr:MAG: septum formation protein Maf [Actinomycetota bacterium]RIK08202.1 MAG: septum formation protein Maf [Acidobacteriota bacterium]
MVLASASPRRHRLLSGLGLDPEVREPQVNESYRPGETPDRHVERLALDKAITVARGRELVVGADTAVVLDSRLIGKPSDAAAARETLRALAGREHLVKTGVAAVVRESRQPPRRATGVETTTVRLTDMTDHDIDWYVSTGEPLDKAGCYGIQGAGGLFVESISGSYSNVVGLPLALTARLVAELGLDLLAFAP